MDSSPASSAAQRVRSRRPTLPLGVLGFLLTVLPAVSADSAWSYPATKKVDVVDTYFGREYHDSYRWMENLADPTVKTWFKAQADYTDALLAKIPGRDRLAEEWLALSKLRPASYRAISFANHRVFYRKTLAADNVGKLYCRQEWNGAEKLLFDPTAYKPGVNTTLQSFAPSWDGRYVVLGLSADGAEISELRIIEVETAQLLPESMYPSYGPGTWSLDSKSFFYDAPKTADVKSLDFELNHKTRLHLLGTAFADDPDVFSNEVNPELGISPKEFAEASVDEANPDWVFGNVSTVENEKRLYYAPITELKKPKITWSVLCQPSDKIVRGYAVAGDYVYAVTHNNAPKYRVVRTRLRQPDWAHAETVVPEAADSIQGIVKSRNFLFVVYSDGILGRIVKVNLATGQATPVKLPAAGTVDLVCPDWQSDRGIVIISSWTFPTTLYDLDGQTDRCEKSIFNTDLTLPGLDNLVAEEVEAPGHDGEKIPLTIIHRKDLKRDGNHSCILEGYGAYGISFTPYFEIRDTVALHDVVVAYAHVRGGSEKGEAWYRGGFKATKPNTWKDFISCAEYLVQHGYTTPQRLAGTGTSAGGILISRAVTDRPDLFAAAVCNVGWANAMRQEFTTNGPPNIPEFGTVKDPVECLGLYAMDGLQHVRTGVKYPAVLGVGGWNDPRVTPWAPAKFIAALQNESTSGKPVLLKINYDNGHFTEEKTVTYRNFAGQYAFMLWQTGHPEFQPRP